MNEIISVIDWSCCFSMSEQVFVADQIYVMSMKLISKLSCASETITTLCKPLYLALDVHLLPACLMQAIPHNCGHICVMCACNLVVILFIIYPLVVSELEVLF